MFMIYAYAIDTQIDEENRKNQQVFLKIRELGLTDDTIFMDEEPANKKEFEELLDTISHGDTLLVRSVVDMDGDINCLTNDILPYLKELKVELISCEEPFLCGLEYADTMKRIVQLLKSFTKQKAKQGYQKAVKENRVGRPANVNNAAKAVELYRTGKYKIAEIVKMTGISKSTLYRHLKE